MKFLKTHRNKILITFGIFMVLLCAFLWGGSASVNHNRNIDNGANTSLTANKKAEDVEFAYMKSENETNVTEHEEEPDNDSYEIGEHKTSPAQNNSHSADGYHMTVEEKTEVPHQIAEEKNDALISGKGENDEFDISQSEETASVNSDNVYVSDKELTCTLSIRCDTIINNISWLDKEKTELVPKDGVIFAEQTVMFYDGETVFNLLTREMKKNKIHMEATKTPVYNSAYIEGIANLYEYDCGELSGWVYRVNGHFPNYGCSKYQLKDGDRVEFMYTCNLGADVGGYNDMSGE